METVTYQFKNFDKMVRNLQQYPDIAGYHYSRGINAVLASISKNAIDADTGNGNIFRFKTPRVLRTGRLALSFNEGIKLSTPRSLSGTVGPTVKYAYAVHEGVGRGKRTKNPFMPRIAKAAQQEADEHMETAGKQITEAIARL